MAINKVIYGGTTLLDVSTDTVTADKVLTGVTAHANTGEVITGTCKYDMDTSEATAGAAEILSGKTAGVNGTLVTGTMTNNGAVAGTIAEKDTAYTIPQGFHDGSGTVGIDETEKAKIVAGNIKSGITILGVTGTMTGADSVTAQAKSVTPSTSEQVVTPDTGTDYLSQVTVAAIPYTETANTYGTTVTIG